MSYGPITVVEVRVRQVDAAGRTLCAPDVLAVPVDVVLGASEREALALALLGMARSLATRVPPGEEDAG